ncbi:CPBP family intramembrane glutamic endopeptidase [Blautia sp.]|uniref:CPBP family intramembrane glutamic endopeptidase n=1 Tax=Blautia sp. TaxID=1955243 RepID=UPI00258A2563|nr:CPBP family intramembrane glutamic endopeptidase [Blautia sp.]
MQQPYIFKKQLVALFATIFFLLFILFFYPNHTLITLTLVYIFIILGLTLIPSLPRIIKYPLWLHLIIYEAPFWTTIFFLPKETQIILNKNFFITTCISGVFTFLILFIGKKEYLNNINGINTEIPITTKNFLFETLNLCFAAICEEICFRAFFISYFNIIVGKTGILISAALFTLTHYLNRWANKNFTTKIYCMQFLLGIVLGTAFYLTHCITLTIILHLLFNSSQFIVLIKRLRAHKACNTPLFNDYD